MVAFELLTSIGMLIAAVLTLLAALVNGRGKK